jgi:hypothetical protein
MSQEDDRAKTLTAGRRVLERWQTPAEFIAKVDELADLVNSEELFNSPAAKFLQDAMVLATFVNYRATEKVHLVEEKEQWPDGRQGHQRNRSILKLRKCWKRVAGAGMNTAKSSGGVTASPKIGVTEH